ncbi:MAG: T9SS type A sorting domain-containing protein, partial [Candidatus Paceibacterota bacterium]
DIFINKLDSNGNFISVLGIGGVSQDFAKCLSIDDSGNLYVSGTFAQTVDFDPGAAAFNLTSNGMNDIFLLKLNSSGAFVWARSFGGVQNDDIRTIKVLNGSLYVSGWNMSTCDFDPGPSIINYTPLVEIDLFISKFSFNGNLLWVRNVGGVGSELIDDIVSDSKGDLYLTGYFTKNMKVKVNNDSVSLSSNGFRNILFIKMNTSGDFIWVTDFGGNSTDYGIDLLISSDDQITLCGAFSNSVNFDKSGGVNIAESNGATDIFIASFTDNTSGIKFIQDEKSKIKIFPNPSNGEVNIISNDLKEIDFVEIYDINGVFIQRLIFDGFNSKFNLNNLVDSIYFFKIFNSDGNLSYQKWIKINQ